MNTTNNLRVIETEPVVFEKPEKEMHSIPIEWGDYTSMKEQFHLYIVKKADGKVINTKGKRNITEIGRLIDMNRGTVRKYLKLAGIL